MQHWSNHAIQYNTTQIIQHKFTTIKYHTLHYTTLPYATLQHNTIQFLFVILPPLLLPLLLLLLLPLLLLVVFIVPFFLCFIHLVCLALQTPVVSASRMAHLFVPFVVLHARLLFPRPWGGRSRLQILLSMISVFLMSSRLCSGSTENSQCPVAAHMQNSESDYIHDVISLWEANILV